MKRPTLREALETLSTSLEDADAVSRDMLRHPQARDLGPRLHRVNYREAWANVETALDVAVKLAEDDRGDPAGSGGSPAH